MKCHTACDELYFVWEVRPVQTRWLVRMNFQPCNVPVIFPVNSATISCSIVQMKEMECKVKVAYGKRAAIYVTANDKFFHSKKTSPIKKSATTRKSLDH